LRGRNLRLAFLCDAFYIGPGSPAVDEALANPVRSGRVSGSEKPGRAFLANAVT